MVEEIKAPSPYGQRLAHALGLPGNKNDPVALAEDLGVSRQAIAKLLDGGSKEMNASNNARAARILNVDPTWLAIGEGIPRPEDFQVRWHERALIEVYRQLPANEQDEFADSLRARFAMHAHHANDPHPFPGSVLPPSTKAPRAKGKA